MLVGLVLVFTLERPAPRGPPPRELRVTLPDGPLPALVRRIRGKARMAWRVAFVNANTAASFERLLDEAAL